MTTHRFICTQCNETAELPKRQGLPRKYCSNRCAQIAKNERRRAEKESSK